jgi:hypothetical protein
MTLMYQIRPADVAAGARYLAHHHHGIKQQLRRNQIISAIAFAVALLGGGFIVSPSLRTLFFALAVVGGIIWAFAYGYFAREQYIRRVVNLATDNKDDFIRTITLDVVDDGIATASELGTGKLNWAAIQQIDVDENYVYLILPSVNVLTIPRRAFSDADMLQQFLTMLRSRTAPAAPAMTAPVKAID